MKKIRLEDLDKRQVFNKPPDGYFDRLPGIIQSKTAQKTRTSSIPLVWRRSLQLIPAAALVVFIAWYSGVITTSQPESGSEEFLSEVTSYDIIIYLEELDISSNEILDEVDLKALSLEFENPDDPLLDNLDIDDENLIELYDSYDLYDSLL